MSKADNNKANRLITEANSQKAEYIAATAEKMSVKEEFASFWRKLAAAVIVDAIPHIPSVVDKVCALVVPGYVGSRDQQALAFGMEVNAAHKEHEKLMGIYNPQSSAVASVIAHHPVETGRIVEGAKNMAKGAAHAVAEAATGSLGGRLVTGVLNAASEIGSALGKHVISEVRADQKVLSASDRKYARAHRSRHGEASAHKSGGRGR